MGHHSAKDVYRQLSKKLDGAAVRLPDHSALRQLLTELYSPEQADLVARMPFTMSSLSRIAEVTGIDAFSLADQLSNLAHKGLVLDVVKESTGERFYMPSPFVIGIFEFTLMRSGPQADHSYRSQLFHEYLESGLFHHANLGNGQQVFVARAIAHGDTFAPSTEILTADSVDAIVAEAAQFCVGVCSCRHEHEHAGGRSCKTPLETCTAMGTSAEYLVRNQLARSISRSEMLDIVSRSRDGGLVLSADNVKSEVGFICHCCSCCCNLVRGITEWGYPNTIVTSPFAPAWHDEKCNGCGRCVKACPIGALSPQNSQGARQPGSTLSCSPTVDPKRCIGCGVCVTRCNRGAVRLTRGTRRRILPEDSFERVILQCLERGTLQNLIFDNPQSLTQRPMRALLGGLLRLPFVQRSLISDALRSTFLRGLAALSGYDGS